MTDNHTIDKKHLRTKTCNEVVLGTRSMRNENGTRKLDGITSWLVCVCVLSASTISNGCLYLYGIFFPFILEEFQESKSRTALVASIAMCVYTLASPIASKICLAVGCRITIVLAGLVGSAGLLASSFAPNLYVLCVGYGLALGFSGSLVYNASFLIIPLYFDKHRFFAMGIISIGVGAGPLIMSPITQAILDHLDWRKTIMVLAGINFLQCLFGCSITRKNISLNERTSENPTPLPKRNRLHRCLTILDFSYLKNPRFMIIVISFALAILGEYTPYFHLAQYAAELGIPGHLSSWLYVGIGTGTMLFRMLTGKLLDVGMIPPLRLSQLSVTLFAIVHFLVPLPKSFALLLVYAFANGILEGINVAAIFSIMIKSYPGMGLGWALFFQGISFLICPVLAGYISDVSGSYHPVFYTAGGIQLFSVCLIQTSQWIKQNIDEEKPEKLDEEELMTVERETVC